MPIVKLTDERGQTYGGCQWGPGVTHEAAGEGPICGKGWIHWYPTPELAVLMNPVHRAFERPRLWECEIDGVHYDDKGLRGGSSRLTTLRELPLSRVTMLQRVQFAVRCALWVFDDWCFRRWAVAWLDGSDRSSGSANAIWSTLSYPAAPETVNRESAALAARSAWTLEWAPWATGKHCGWAAERAAKYNRVLDTRLDITTLARLSLGIS